MKHCGPAHKTPMSGTGAADVLPARGSDPSSLIATASTISPPKLLFVCDSGRVIYYPEEPDSSLPSIYISVTLFMLA